MDIKSEHYSTPNLAPQVVILGVWDEKIQNLTLVNHLILIFKRYIYLKRKDGLNFYGLKSYIKSIENIEPHKDKDKN